MPLSLAETPGNRCGPRVHFKASFDEGVEECTYVLVHDESSDPSHTMAHCASRQVIEVDSKEGNDWCGLGATSLAVYKQRLCVR